MTVGWIMGTGKLRIRKLFGIVLAGIGVIFLLIRETRHFHPKLRSAIFVLCSIHFPDGIYVAISKDILTRNEALRAMTWIFIFASLICVPFGAVSMSSVHMATVEPKIWLSARDVALIGTAVPYLLNAWGLARVNPSTVAVFVYLQPVIGFMMAVVFLGEHVVNFSLLPRFLSSQGSTL